MTMLAQHIAALIVEIAKQRQGNFSFFLSDLPKPLEDIYDIKVPRSMAEAACDVLIDVGGCTRLVSPLTGDMYQVSYLSSIHLFDPENGPDENSSLQYDARFTRANSEYPVMTTYYAAGATWIDRVRETLSGMNLAEIESNIADPDNAAFVPASDRIVRVDHNQPEIIELEASLVELEDLVRSDNSDEIPFADRSRFREQISSASRLLKLDRLSVRALGSLLLPVLTYLTLHFSDEAIGEISKALLKALKVHFGLEF